MVSLAGGETGPTAYTLPDLPFYISAHILPKVLVPVVTDTETPASSAKVFATTAAIAEEMLNKIANPVDKAPPVGGGGITMSTSRL